MLNVEAETSVGTNLRSEHVKVLRVCAPRLAQASNLCKERWLFSTALNEAFHESKQIFLILYFVSVPHRVRVPIGNFRSQIYRTISLGMLIL
jgi:hypothetical protein